MPEAYRLQLCNLRDLHFRACPSCVQHIARPQAHPFMRVCLDSLSEILARRQLLLCSHRFPLAEQHPLTAQGRCPNALYLGSDQRLGPPMLYIQTHMHARIYACLSACLWASHFLSSDIAVSQRSPFESVRGTFQSLSDSL